jgi:hypothetical protein
VQKNIATVALWALFLLVVPAFAAEAPRRGEGCSPALRACLQGGRPALRACIRECRAASGGTCPRGVDVEDCRDQTLQGCVAACRDGRRIEIRQCVRAAAQCSAACRATPGPTVTPTPG